MLYKANAIGASAVLPYSDEIAASFTYIDRFDEQYQNYRRADDKIHIPRNRALGMLDYRDPGLQIDVPNLFTPRDSQQAQLVGKATALAQAGKSFIFQAPTGSGKTYMGSAIAAELKVRFLVLVTKEDLIDQWKKAINAVLGIPKNEIGLWQADTVPSIAHKAVIGMVHSVAKGPERYGSTLYKGFGLVLCDEVHRMGADQFSQAMWWLPAKIRVGLSATPNRKDGRTHVFLDHIGPVEVVGKQEVMIPKVLLKTTAWKNKLVYRGGRMVKMPHEHGRTMGINKLLAADPERNRLITDFVRAAYKRERNVIVFSDIIEHLTTLHTEFISAGLPPQQMGYYAGLDSGLYTPGKDKAQQREAVKTRKIILATYAMASEATDIPWLDTAVLATPRSDVNQIVGRIRREFENKKQPVVFDLIDEDSPVLQSYAKARSRWYRSLGAELVPVA